MRFGIFRTETSGKLTAESVDPADVTAFTTELTFVGGGQLSGSMTPITEFVESVPEPTTILLLGLGLA